MENQNTQNFNIKKQEKLLQEIDQLEAEITTVRNKIQTWEIEEKLETYKSNLLEVKKDNLKREIKFYEEYLEKINKKLADKQSIYLNFTTLNEYYDKLLEMYREQHLQHENSGCNLNIAQEISLLEVNSYFETEMHSSEKQVKTLTSAIEMNSATLKNLLKECEWIVP